MTLADMVDALPLNYSDSLDKALVFDSATAQRLAEVQSQYGSAAITVSPVLLTDGRWMVSADLLSEVGEGGLLAVGFSHLNAANFSAIDVVPMEEAAPLIPCLEIASQS